MFGTSENYYDVDFLKRIYVTDLSHFAVQGKANKIKGVKNWNKIRNKIASEFMKEEINFIKPKYIISQGNVVADFIDEQILKREGNILDIKLTTHFKDLPNKCQRTPTFIKYFYQNRKIIHLRLPHIASGNTNYFWIPAQKEKRKARLQNIRKGLEDFENKNCTEQWLK